MNNMLGVLDKYKNKKVLITGHTGFKGAWLCKILLLAGADVIGYALEPTIPSLFKILNLEKNVDSIFGDVCDYERLLHVFNEKKPEIIIHLAAQPLVKEGYINPRKTYETNVMGTVNICECIRKCDYVNSFLNVTTDKVYQNKEWVWGYRETDMLDGFDPYSNSKSCSELVTHSYINSFFLAKEISASTARAGNVIGGGDFAANRIIPDCVRAAIKNEKIIVRNPYSVRPYQHVLEPLSVYLMIAEEQIQNRDVSGFYNVGPEDIDCITTGNLVDMFCTAWGNGMKWEKKDDDGPKETDYLKLDCSSIKKTFEWKPKWNIKTAIEKTVEWSKLYAEKLVNMKGGCKSLSICTEQQIKDYFIL